LYVLRLKVELNKSDKMKKVLITGSNGYLSQFIIKEIGILKDCILFGIDIQNESSYPEIRYLKCNLCEKTETEKTLKEINPDYIIHLAATFSNEFKTSFAINVNGSANLLECAAGLQKVPKIVFAGSAAEYGIQDNNEQPVNENSDTNPQNVYGITKLIQTTLGLNYARIKNIDLTIGRVFNLLGPDIPDAFVVGKIENQIKNILKGKQSSIQLYRLDSVRDFIDVRDVAKILLHLVRNAEGQKVINVGNGQPVSIQELLNSFLEKAGLSHLKNIQLKTVNKSEVSYCIADISRLAIHYTEKKYTLDESVKAIIEIW
jgi:GDP-4-dehydro-6-deoxy-D-mannose reductase